MNFTIHVQTVSEANQREHWRKRQARKKDHFLRTLVAWRSARMDSGEIPSPCVITLTRYSCRQMDSDNLAGSFKHVQDQIARLCNFDDGDKTCVSWIYSQVQIKQRKHYVSVEIEVREDQ